MSAKFNIKALVTAAGIAAGAISGVSAETLGPVTDPLGVVKIPKGAPIHIGGYWTLSGPDIDIGLDQKRGAEIAMDDWGNAVAGHPIEFHAEDSHCSAEGGQTAATRLASNRNIVVVIGPDCSSAGTPGGPYPVEGGHPKRSHLDHRAVAYRTPIARRVCKVTCGPSITTLLPAPRMRSTSGIR